MCLWVNSVRFLYSIQSNYDMTCVQDTHEKRNSRREITSSFENFNQLNPNTSSCMMGWDSSLFIHIRKYFEFQNPLTFLNNSVNVASEKFPS
jgi:hypothetical protein